MYIPIKYTVQTLDNQKQDLNPLCPYYDISVYSIHSCWFCQFEFLDSHGGASGEKDIRWYRKRIRIRVFLFNIWIVFNCADRFSFLCLSSLEPLPPRHQVWERKKKRKPTEARASSSHCSLSFSASNLEIPDTLSISSLSSLAFLYLQAKVHIK